MNTLLSRKKLLTFGASVIFSTFFLHGCQKEEDVNYDSSITNSSELKDFIIAAADLRHSLMIFESELAKVDFANLESIVEANGRRVTYLPASIRNLTIEQEVLLVNQKKEALLNKYSQFASFDFDNMAKCINHCATQSMEVSDCLIEKNINIYQPLSKAAINESSFTQTNALVGYLYNWVLSPDYVEVVIYFFTDGTSLVILDDHNTTTQSVIAYTTVGSKHYYQGKEISSVSHTHRSSSTPSLSDQSAKTSMPYCSHSIYYSGSFNFY